jgi:LDH2 family malate/lactate/ureidoglycolate dehydrogenase
MSGAIPARALTEFCRNLFIAAGTPERVAADVAASLVYADMRGVASHGVVRTAIYTQRLEKGLVAPHAEPVIERKDGSVMLIDGASNYGAYVGRKAMGHAIALADKLGVGCVGVRHSTHFGMAAFYARDAIARGKIAIVLSNASQIMPPPGGIRPFIGTNPLCIAMQTPFAAPFILDMATSVVARGKIMAAAARGEPIPEGWATDAGGRPTTDAQAALGGLLLPLGGAKGFMISMAIDILCGVLTGAGFGPGVGNMYKNWTDEQDIGHFFLVVDVERFMPFERFLERIGAYLTALKAEPRAPGVDELLYAGEIEHRLERKAMADGIELPPSVLADLRDLAGKYRIETSLFG